MRSLYCLQHLLQGHRWQWPSSPLLRQAPASWEKWSVMTFYWQCGGHLATHDTGCVYLCVCLCGEGHLRCEGWIFVRCVWKGQVWALTAAATSLKSRGGSSGETRDPQQSSVKAAGESCQCRRLNLYRPSLCLTLTLASLWLIVSALQTLSILSCLKRDAESKGKNESIFGCCKQKKTKKQKNRSTLCGVWIFPVSCLHAKSNFPSVPHTRERRNSFAPFSSITGPFDYSQIKINWRRWR